ncbi:MAG: hypothetical protein ABID87_00950 [Chloroflexota bacterium]
MGVPAVAVVTTHFTNLAKVVAKSLGVPNAAIVSVPHPLGGIPPAEARAKADTMLEEVINALIHTGAADKAETATPAYPAEKIRVSGDFAGLYRALYDKGWTDGLPVIPPAPEYVKAMLKGTSHKPDEVVGELAPMGGIATVERIAINAVMAGCRPEYFPVVLAAVSAISDPANNMAGWASTTGSNSPLLIINGPVRQEIGLNCGGNALGAGNQANATIGRAIGLMTHNIGGAKPQVSDMTTLGAAWEYTNCLGENEEALPKGWGPLAAERGFAAGTSTVTVKAINSQVDIFAHIADDFRMILDTTAASITGLNNFGILKDMQLIIGYNPEAATLAEKGGWSKKDIRQYLFEKARQPLHIWKTLGDNAVAAELMPEAKTESDDYMMRMIPRPEDIIIAVLGGLGKHSTWWPGGQGQAVTRAVDEWR